MGKNVCWIGIVISALWGLIAIITATTNFVMGFGYTAISVLIVLFVMIVGPMLSWVGSFLLYGFGELIENTSKLVDYTGKTERNRINGDLW